MASCYKCSADFPLEGRPGRKEECPSCAASLRCCLGCRFHDPSAHNQCREPGTDFIRDREAANFCDSFEMSEGGGAAPREDQEAAKSALADLFKI
jgi:hypothetical protein